MVTRGRRRGILRGVGKRATAEAFRGRWRIVSTEQWDREALDLVQPAFVRVDGNEGDFGMIAVRGWLEYRYGERDLLPAVEFTWQVSVPKTPSGLNDARGEGRDGAVASSGRTFGTQGHRAKGRLFRV